MTLIATWYFAFLAAIFIPIFWRYLKWRFSSLNKFPGPSCNFFFGVFPQIATEPYMQPQQRWWNEAGQDTPFIHYSSAFGRQFLMVLDADGVKQVLASPVSVERPSFTKSYFYAYLRKVTGHGMLTMDGPDWHRHRRIIQPSFNNHFLKEALNACVPRLVDRLIDSWRQRPGGDIDIASHYAALTLDVIGKVAFAHDFHSLDSVASWAKDETKDIESSDPLIKSLQYFLTPNIVRMLLLNFGLIRLEKYILPESHETEILLEKAVDAVIGNAYERYKAGGFVTNNVNGNGSDVKCLLEYLFEAEDTEVSSRNRRLSHKEMRAETKTFVVAGQETTATLCYWASYCLAKYPHVQKHLFDDITKHAPNSDNITLEHAEKMEYLDAFLSEVLRMYPPVGYIVRVNHEKCQILGHDIPPNTRVNIPMYILQRHPKYWEDPLEFKPERWLKSRASDTKYHHFAYLPFSAGGRNCIGQRFAIYEAKLIMAAIIREFELQFSPLMDGVDVKLSGFLTMKSNPSVVMQAKTRT